MIPEKPKLRALSVFPYRVEGRPVLCLKDPEGITDQVATIPLDLGPFLLEMLDGNHTLRDIQAELVRRSGGRLIPLDDIEHLVGQLDEALFLDSPRFSARVAELLAEYRAAPVRRPALAGSAYPADPAEARSFLDGFYAGGEGPREEGTLRALAVPHLDLSFGGPVAARALGGLADRLPGETVVVLGVGHQLGRLPYALTGKDFETPLGTVRADRDLLDRVVDKAGSWVLEEELAHRAEHSVEFAALLLAHALEGRSFRILPVLCGSFHGFLESRESPAEDPLIGAFLETLAEEAGDALLYASVDLAHLGPHYGDPRPLAPARLREIERADRELLALAEAGDAEGFLAHQRACRDERRVCGMSALYTLLSLLPEDAEGRLLAYEQPVFPAEGNTVTIAAMTWTAAPDRPLTPPAR